MQGGVHARFRIVRLLVFVPLGVVAAVAVAYLAGFDFGRHEEFVGRWSALVLELGAGVACLARVALVRRERLAWALVGIGVLLWGLGDAYYRIFLYYMDSPPVPSVADGFWIAFYPFVYSGIVLLIRARARGAGTTVWVDGLIAALAVAGLATAVVFDAVLGSIGGEPLATATNLTYPLADGLLLALVVAAFAITGWHLDRTWIWLAAGLAVFAVSDSFYLYQVAQGTYQVGGVLDFGWPAALLLTGVSAWMIRSSPPAARRAESWRSIILPIAFGCLAIAISFYDHFEPVTHVSIALASACLLAVLGRLAFTFAQNVRMLRVRHEESVTDQLTGLANRRRLVRDLDDTLADADSMEPHVLMLMDLNGFKFYNDSFGHPAGDALLQRLGARLADEADGHGVAYRIGGDEFCALFPVRERPAERVVADLAATLSERGEGFAIDCSYGWVRLPADAGSPEMAMRTADQRMYAQKEGGRASARAQSRDVLLQTLMERSPELGSHLNDVATLAARTAEELGLSENEVEQIRIAGELHDVGKIAIPDAILKKPGSLDPSEWEYVKRHSAVGERIVAAAPALASVAKLIRSVHERLDGGGYPDGLPANDIPLGSRIVAVCDAYDAMTTERPYRRTMEHTAALAELEANAGTQFDPDVVRAFTVAVERTIDDAGATATA